MSKLNLIAAVDEQLGIGANNDLMWHLPDDFKWFKENTLNHTVVMGRKTMESLPKALPKRKNLVLSRNPEIVPAPFIHVESIESVLELSKTESIFIIGGGSIYEAFLPHCNSLYLTRVRVTIPEADTFFPTFQYSAFNQTFRLHHPKDDKHKYAFDLEIYERKPEILSEQ